MKLNVVGILCSLMLAGCASNLQNNTEELNSDTLGMTVNLQSALVQPLCTYSGSRDAYKYVLSGRVALPNGDVEPRAIVVRGDGIEAIKEIDELTDNELELPRLDCKNSFFSPALINAHEHTGYSYQLPPEGMANDYQHRLEWRRGGSRAIAQQPSSSYDPAVLSWVELRHLLSGSTTVAGSGGVEGLVRNVSSRHSDDILVDLKTDPYWRSEIEKMESQCVNNQASQARVSLSYEEVPAVPHVGEGVNCLAEKELDVYLNFVASKDNARRYSLIHGVALKPRHTVTLKNRNVSVIWSPRSNVALYGESLDSVSLLDAGVTVGLGTDWSPSGSFNMFEEMKCAQKYSKAKSSREISGEELWKMATMNNAVALGLSDSLGSLEKGKSADIILIRDNENTGLRDMPAKTASDVLAVFSVGKLLAYDQIALPAGVLSVSCSDSIGSKAICVDFERIYGETLLSVANKNRENIGIFDVSGQAECVFN